jgi:hypothetical protein
MYQKPAVFCQRQMILCSPMCQTPRSACPLSTAPRNPQGEIHNWRNSIVPFAQRELSPYELLNGFHRLLRDLHFSSYHPPAPAITPWKRDPVVRVISRRIFQPEVGFMPMMVSVVLMKIPVLYNAMTVCDRAFFVISAFVFPQGVVADVLNEEGSHLLY